MNADRFAIVDGLRIAYTRKGRGEPMLLVHGIATYSFLWRRLIPGLAERHDVIALDLPGCGDSDKPPERDYSIRSQARTVKQFLDALGVTKIHLVTHDVGGGIGQLLAVGEPDMVASLVLINSVGYDYWPVQPIVTMRIPVVRQLAMAIMDLGMLRTLIRRGLFHKDRATGELMKLFEKPLKTKEGKQGFLQFAKSLNSRHLTDRGEDLRRLRLPVLIIRGDADPYLDHIISDRLHREIPGSRLEVIKTGGHFIQEDEPELLVGLILDFLASEAGCPRELLQSGT